MLLMILFAAVCLFLASFVYSSSQFAFFTFVLIAESIFLAQFNVFIPILVVDRFTPLESQKTFPFVESADTAGMMLGGVIVGIFASKIPIPIFLYIKRKRVPKVFGYFTLRTPEILNSVKVKFSLTGR